jgi:hypothetical protein
VERVVVHGDHAEEMVVGLGDRLARPVAVDVAHLEVLEVPAERALVHGHPLPPPYRGHPRLSNGGKPRRTDR